MAIRRRFTRRAWPSLDAEIALPQAAVGGELGRGAGPGDPPALQDGVALAELHRPVDILVDRQNGETAAAELGEHAPDLFAQERRQAFRRLVEDEELGV